VRLRHIDAPSALRRRASAWPPASAPRYQHTRTLWNKNGGVLTEVVSWLSAAVICRRYLAVVLRPLLAAPFLVRRSYLIVAPRPLPEAPLAVRRTYLIGVLDGADACLSRPTQNLAVVVPPAPATQSASSGEQQSADKRRNRATITRLMHTEKKQHTRRCIFG